MLLSYKILQKSSVCSEKKMTSSLNQMSLEEKKKNWTPKNKVPVVLVSFNLQTNIIYTQEMEKDFQ